MKKVLALILLLMMVVSIFAGCNGIGKRARKNVCETEKITIMESSDLSTIQGKIKDIGGNAGTLYIASKDKMYEYTPAGAFNGDAFNIIGNSVYLINRSCKLMKMEDGTITGFYYNSDIEKYLSFTGLKSDGLLYAFVKPGKQVVAIRKTGEDFYVETYNVNEYGATSFVSKETLMSAIASLVNTISEQSVIKDVIVSDASKLLIMFDNGQTVAFRVIAGFGAANEIKLQDAGVVYTAYVSDTTLEVEKVVYQKGTLETSFCLYTEAGDGNGSETSISLPDKYKTEDIKNVIAAKDALMIEFNDGSIYVTDKESVNDFQYLQALSELNQNGKVKKIVAYKGFVVLQDDGKVYKIEY